MNKFDNVLEPLNIDDDVKLRLSQHLLRTVEGSNDAYVTPIGENYNPDKILSDFDAVFKANSSKLNSTLIDLENSNRDKFGPRSKASPWSQRKPSLAESFEIDKDDSYLAIANLRGQRRLRPLSKDKALELLKNNTNSGLPSYTRKGKVKERVSLKFDELLRRKDPCILFTRTQEQNKTRDVWGYPMADTLNEMRYYSPLLVYQKKLNYRAAIVSPDEVNAKMTDLISRAVISGKVLLSIDFRWYDRTVKSTLQKHAFNYIKSLFQPACDAEISYIEDRFRNIGILTPDGVMKGNHGVPSGSTFTNEVDSIVQASIGMSHPFITSDDFQVQGDDGVYILREDEVEKLKDSFKSHGLVVNEEKSYVSHNYAIYLQNLYHVDYEVNGIIGGIYPVYRALNRLVYQERWSDFEDFGISGKDYYSIRAICILENCKYHPLFRELVKFIYDLDKYSLDTSDQGIVNYVQMIDNSKGAGGIINHQYGDNVKGIKSFETYKLIKSLS